MKPDYRQKLRSFLITENNLSPRATNRGGILHVCLVSPSRYQTGMSSLGFQKVYSLIASFPDITCERAFLPDREDLDLFRDGGGQLLSLERQRPLSDFDIIAFSTSFEPDYLNIPLILKLASIPLLSSNRNAGHPLIIAGGAAFFINPEPVADFLDLICIGEGETIVPALLSTLTQRTVDSRQALLRKLSLLPGIYVPTLYELHYHQDVLTAIEAKNGAPAAVSRVCVPLEEHPPASTVILTENTEFGDMFLIEISRGCPRGCRFCTSGFIYAPFRQHPLEHLLKLVDEGLLHRKKIGLVGAAVSDYSEIGRLCSYIVEKGGKVSVSSLRIDRLDQEMLDALTASGHKTISLAPEGGSQRLRDLIRKNLTEEQILSACEMLISRDVLNLKLYFIIGLPTETEEDLQELIRLVIAIRERVLEKARINRRIGEITLSVNPFIPKPFTPFQWCGMESLQSLERKVKFLEKNIRGIANVQMKVESLKSCYFQALLSRGGRELSGLLTIMADGTNLKKSAKLTGIDTDATVLRNIEVDQMLPWDVIASDDRQMLLKEYQRALVSAGNRDK